MTQRKDGLYTTVGTNPPRPKWYIKWRGLYWLLYGLCPWCYSSPPFSACPVCQGSYVYGPNISDRDRELWREKFLDYLQVQYLNVN